MLGVGAVPGLIMLIGVIFLPESPRWWIINGKIDKAKEVLIKLRGHVDVEDELNHIVSSVSSSRTESFMDTLRKIGSSTSVKRAMVVGCGLQAFQQLSAINTVMYYSATIIEMAGVEDESEILWLAAAVAGGNFVFTIFVIFIVDRIRRRKLMIASLFGVVIGLLLLATVFVVVYKDSARVNYQPPANGTDKCRAYDRCFTCLEDPHCGFCYVKDGDSFPKASCLTGNTTNRNEEIQRPDYCSPVNYGFSETNYTSQLHWSHISCPTKNAWLAVSGMIFYLAMFAIGVGPLPWAINAEIYPLWARNVGTGAATTTNWVFNLMISFTFLNLIELLTKSGVFVFYSVISFMGVIFFYLLLPETKGVKLELVEHLFEGTLLVPWK